MITHASVERCMVNEFRLQGFEYIINFRRSAWGAGDHSGSRTPNQDGFHTTHHSLDLQLQHSLLHRFIELGPLLATPIHGHTLKPSITSEHPADSNGMSRRCERKKMAPAPRVPKIVLLPPWCREEDYCFPAQTPEFIRHAPRSPVAHQHHAVSN